MPRRKVSKDKEEVEKPAAIRRCRKARLDSVHVSQRAYVRPLSSPFLCKKFAHYICSHNTIDAMNLLPVLCDDKCVAQDALIRGCMIVVTTKMNSGTIQIDHNLASLLFTFFSSYCIKSEVLLELMAFYLSNREFQAAQQDLLVRAGKYLGHGYTSENFILIELLSTTYFALLDFVFWWEATHQVDFGSNQVHSKESLELMTSQLTLRIKSILNSGPGPFDIIIPPMLDVLLYKNDLKEAQSCLMNYKKKNPTNLNASIYLFKFLDHFGNQLEDGDFLQQEIALYLAENSPSDPLVLDIVEDTYLPLAKRIRILMEFVDFLENKDNLKAWRILSRLVGKAKRRADVALIKETYESIYSSYWQEYHFESGQLIASPSMEEISLIRSKTCVASFLSNSLIKFVQDAEGWLNFHDPEQEDSLPST